MYSLSDSSGLGFGIGIKKLPLHIYLSDIGIADVMLDVLCDLLVILRAHIYRNMQTRLLVYVIVPLQQQF